MASLLQPEPRPDELIRTLSRGAVPVRDVQLSLLKSYRRNPELQEGIELALLEELRREAHPTRRARVEEMLTLLDHVHDPWIG